MLFRSGTLNVNGARDIYKRALIYEFIKEKGVDVMLLQETHSDVSNETDWRREWEGEALFSHMSSTRGGVAVLFAKHFLPITYEVQHVIDGRFMIIKAQYERFKVYFVNVYAPTVGTDRVCFLRNVRAAWQNCCSVDFLFMGGDLNCTADDSMDRNQTEPHTASQQTLLQLLQLHSLCAV